MHKKLLQYSPPKMFAMVSYNKTLVSLNIVLKLKASHSEGFYFFLLNTLKSYYTQVKKIVHSVKQIAERVGMFLLYNFFSTRLSLSCPVFCAH